MSTTPTRTAFPRRAPRLLAAPAQLASAVLAVALVGATWQAAAQGSHAAWLDQAAAAAPVVQRITLPPVTVVAHREAHRLAAVACANGGRATL